jgi:hypothetical protein
MRKVERGEVKDLVAYEKAREAMRAHVIGIKTHRRVAVGPNLSVLFENRDTVLFQIQEMVRTERLVDDARIQEEIDVYNALLPERGELSATIFIEIPELVRMTPDEVRETVNRFQGLDRDSVWLVMDGLRIPASFESGHTREEKMAAVHYVRFALPDAARAALREGSADARLVVEHPEYRAETSLGAETRRALREDLLD